MKRGIIFVVVCLLTIGLALAEVESEASGGVDRAIRCLKDKLGSDCGNTKSTVQSAFSLLAMAGDSEIRGACKTSLLDKEREDCWGDSEGSSCSLKSTALSILALNHAGSNVKDEADWLLAYRKRAPGLEWFLEIDTNNASRCTVGYEGNVQAFNIGGDKKITGSSGCLSPSDDGYFLKIKDTCYERNFTISCNKDFISTVFYKKSGDNAYHLSGGTHGAPADDSTYESVESYCFAKGGVCDYEGSLWAALALAKVGENIGEYLAYLSANADENKGFLPYAFLYMLTNDDEYYIKLIEQQKEGKYWDDSGNKLYDSGLALLALQNLNLDAVSSSKTYLFEVQGADGCWTSISNTALLVFAISPSEPIGGGGAVTKTRCEDSGKYCVASGECGLGNVLDNLYCIGLSDVCCNVQPLQESCYDKGGIVCRSDQRCTGDKVISSDSNYCCLDSCVAVNKINECENSGYKCESQCSENQAEKTGYSCDVGVCCSEEEGVNYFWIIVLIILIILVLIGILLRKKLREWVFKLRNGVKFKKVPVGKKPGGRLPPPAMHPMIPQQRPRMPPGGMMRRPVRRVEKDKDFDDVMKKLKDMSR